MSVAQCIVAVLFVLQILGLGVVLGKLGETKYGKYTCGDLIVNIIIATMLIYIFMELCK